MKKLYWFRFTFTTFTGEQTFMYPMPWRHLTPADRLFIENDLDMAGYPYEWQFSGISYLDDPYNAAYYYYIMEV